MICSLKVRSRVVQKHLSLFMNLCDQRTKTRCSVDLRIEELYLLFLSC
jgi:hypothetical protein